MPIESVLYAAFLAPGLFCLVAGMIALAVKRRLAPRACALGLAAFAFLLILNVGLTILREWMFEAAAQGNTFAMQLWQYNGITLISSVGHGVGVLMVVRAILADRPAFRDSGDDS